MWLRRGWKPALALLILVLVARHFLRILSQPELDPYPFALRIPYLIPAAALYLGAHTCWAWFWVRLLRSQGVQVRFTDGLRAYFVSQFGKYIPGKAWVILIRVAMLRSASGGTPLVVGITATYETLTSMGAGALIGMLLLPWVGVVPKELSDNFALVIAVAAMPLVLGALNKLAARRIAKLRGPDAPPLPSPPLTLLMQGLLHGVAGWCLLGLGLGFARCVPRGYGRDGARLCGGVLRAGRARRARHPRSDPAVRSRSAIHANPRRNAGERPGRRRVPRASIDLDVGRTCLHGPLLSPPEACTMTPVVEDVAAVPYHQPAATGEAELLSLVIPVFNEKESLEPLFAEIAEVAASNRLRIEVIFVDDGSTDGSWKTIERIAAADERVKAIRFRRNFGKAAALAAGFKAAAGKAIMTLDADLQDDPHEIPRFLTELRNGLDVVSGWKKLRHDPWHKVWPSRVFNGMVGVVTGVKLHDHNCGMKAYRSEVLREVRLYGELHRFVPVLAAARGFKIGELVINHRQRKFGYSKYGIRRFAKGFLDLLTVKFLTGFGHRPQHLLGNFGLFPVAIGILGMLLLAVNAVVRIGSEHTVGAAGVTQIVVAIISVGLLLFGAQLAIAGLIAELIVDRGPDDLDPYCIAETLQSEPDK
jgi:glycosyltransferase involved in cell wall biosynthesis